MPTRSDCENCRTVLDLFSDHRIKTLGFTPVQKRDSCDVFLEALDSFRRAGSTPAIPENMKAAWANVLSPRRISESSILDFYSECVRVETRFGTLEQQGAFQPSVPFEENLHFLKKEPIHMSTVLLKEFSFNCDFFKYLHVLEAWDTSNIRPGSRQWLLRAASSLKDLYSKLLGASTLLEGVSPLDIEDVCREYFDLHRSKTFLSKGLVDVTRTRFPSQGGGLRQKLWFEMMACWRKDIQTTMQKRLAALARFKLEYKSFFENSRMKKLQDIRSLCNEVRGQLQEDYEEFHAVTYLRRRGIARKIEEGRLWKRFTSKAASMASYGELADFVGDCLHFLRIHDAFLDIPS